MRFVKYPVPHPASRTLPAALLAGICAAAGLAGCDVTIRDGDIQNVSLRARATRDWNRVYPLAEGGRIEIVNNDGSVEASAGPPGTVRISAVLVARAMTEARAKEILNEASLVESATQDHVRVATARDRGHRGLDIAINVVLPADASLEMTGNNGEMRATGLRGHVKAMIVNGGLELDAMSGTVDAAAVNGTISAKMMRVIGPMRFESTNGRIALEIPKSAKATLNARSVNGGITVSGLAAEGGTGRRIRTLESHVNGGGPEIDLRVTNGRIAITGVDRPDSR